jgi:hypothetical protein
MAQKKKLLARSASLALIKFTKGVSDKISFPIDQTRIKMVANG